MSFVSRWGLPEFDDKHYFIKPGIIARNETCLIAAPTKEVIAEDGTTKIVYDTEHEDFGKVIGLTDREAYFIEKVMMFHYDSENGQACPSMQRLAFYLGKSVTATRNASNALQEKGFLRITTRYNSEGGQTTNVYDFSAITMQCIAWAKIREVLGDNLFESEVTKLKNEEESILEGVPQEILRGGTQDILTLRNRIYKNYSISKDILAKVELSQDQDSMNQEIKEQINASLKAMITGKPESSFIDKEQINKTSPDITESITGKDNGGNPYSDTESAQVSVLPASDGTFSVQVSKNSALYQMIVDEIRGEGNFDEDESNEPPRLERKSLGRKDKSKITYEWTRALIKALKDIDVEGNAVYAHGAELKHQKVIREMLVATFPDMGFDSNDYDPEPLLVGLKEWLDRMFPDITVSYGAMRNYCTSYVKEELVDNKNEKGEKIIDAKSLNIDASGFGSVLD